MTKTVCIVGAGPSGLVAAKTLLHDVAPGTFKVTIYDAQSRIGGLWPISKNDIAGLVHPLMVANQSKHTVQFSDLAWDDAAPQLPKAYQVGQYIERYWKTYGDADLQLGHKVLRTELQDSGSWKVETESQQGIKTSVFDYLLVATGFFGKPIWPDCVPKDAGIPVVHSSKYRDLPSLLGKGSSGRGDKILVVGGQMSGIEIASTIACHLSSAANSPGDGKPVSNPDKYSVQHVASRPSWIFPLFTSPKPDTAAPPFLPCDLPAYNVAVRPAPLENTQGHISVDAARTFNAIYQSVLGTDQGEYSPEIQVDGSFVDEQPFLAMSSYYTDFVRSGLISVSRGTLASLSGTTATLEASGEEIRDVAAVVLATGFDPAPSLAFLPQSVLESLSFAPTHPSLPIALAFHGTHHPSLPTLGFVGFYRSPYWGVMEMQARFVAHKWSTPAASPALTEALRTDDSIKRTIALRSDPRLSQFPMGDYPFLMQDFSRALEIPISRPLDTPPLANGKAMDIVTPARYASPGITATQRDEVEKNLECTHSTVIDSLTKGAFVPQAVFRSLLGEWHLDRTITSRLPSQPSGRFIGTAKFLLRDGTLDGRESQSRGDPDLDLGREYLYVEDGNFAADNGMTFRATRRYIWRYDEVRDRLSVWFARTDDNSRADYLFHEIDFLVPEDEGGDEAQESKKGWQARASHLCVEDLYDVKYEFGFKAVNLREWRCGYTVKGPKKDYSIDGTYKRR